jgi:hypothetical protein
MQDGLSKIDDCCVYSRNVFISPLEHRCAFFIKQLRKPQYQLNVQVVDLIKLLIKRMTSPSPSIS